MFRSRYKLIAIVTAAIAVWYLMLGGAQEQSACPPGSEPVTIGSVMILGCH